MFTVEYTTWRQAAPGGGEAVQALEEDVLGEQSPALDHWGGEQEPSSPNEIDDENLDADHDDDAPLRLRSIYDILRLSSPCGFVSWILFAEQLVMVSSDEPLSFSDAEHHPSWRKAMIEEMESIEDNATWTLTDLPAGRRAIGLKWVFKVKRDEHEAVAKYKARLVVKGYAQKQGIDYDEVFAPVAQHDTVRLLIALAAHEGWEVHHMDVKSVFLNGDL